MNKFSFLTYLLLSLTITVQIEMNGNILDIIYDKAIIIIKGMSEQSHVCYDTLANNKTVILPALIELITLFQNQSRIIDPDDLVEILSKLGDISGKLVLYCNAISLYNLFKNSRDDEKRIDVIKTFGENILHNNQSFYDGSSNFIRERGLDAKLRILGKIIRAITNINFY